MIAVPAQQGPADVGFGVYVHWPFCAQKCPYCDFNSHVRFGGWDEARFLDAYLSEIAHVAERIGPRTVTSIFFGGGTPSLMKPETTAAIIGMIERHWSLAQNCEITLEANPGSVEAGRFRGYRDARVNRISIGIQSLRDDELRRLGRIHTVAEAKKALGIAAATFERYSFDLIYARPGASEPAWREELGEALDLAGDHLSLYQLTIEPDTPYAALHAAGKLIVPDGELAARLYQVTQDMMAVRGLAAYEISNHARAGAESRHNLLYWRYGEYAGIGPGAHGRIITRGARHATATERNPEAWCARVEQIGHGITELSRLSAAEQADEMLLMGLRLTEGIDLERLGAIGGIEPDHSVIAKLEELGLVAWASETTLRSEARDEDAATTINREYGEIAACLGPGLAPDAVARTLPRRLRATANGRFVLNAVVAELSRSFKPLRRIDFQAGAF